jgi:hypothetical protein
MVHRLLRAIDLGLPSADLSPEVVVALEQGDGDPASRERRGRTDSAEPAADHGDSYVLGIAGSRKLTVDFDGLARLAAGRFVQSDWA